VPSANASNAGVTGGNSAVAAEVVIVSMNINFQFF
jgi:hypothetical protein